MKVGDIFQSPYLKAMDLDGKFIKATISKIEVIDVAGKGDKGDMKPVASLQNRQKRLVLNKTNSFALAKAFGTEEMDDWVGESIEVYPDVTQMQGKTVDCIRVRKPMVADFDDDVRF